MHIGLRLHLHPRLLTPDANVLLALHFLERVLHGMGGSELYLGVCEQWN